MRDAVERWSSGMPALGRERETKWVQQNLNVRTFLRHVRPDQPAVVHYEDLVRDPDRAVQSLCAAIGLPFEPATLRPETRQLMNPNLGDPNFHLHAGIDADAADGWQARYEEDQLRAETLQLMQILGMRSASLRAAVRAA